MNSKYTMDWILYCRILEMINDSNPNHPDYQAHVQVNDDTELERILSPIKQGQVYSWSDACKGITEDLKTTDQSVGLYIGSEISRSSIDLLQSIAFGISYGTKYIFSDQDLHQGPLLRTTEKMCGYPIPLLSDLTRTHYALIVGEDPEELHWGTNQMDQRYTEYLRHSRTKKKIKVVSAHSKAYSWNSDIDLHISVRPGTEPFFLLGIFKVSIERGWVDTQYIRDYTEGFSEIIGLLESWSVARCAQICGVEPSEISGVGLKFSRAAMALVHLNPGFFLNHHAALGGWAWMALHMISANALRPGGIYENPGGFDFHPLLSSIPSQKAPRVENIQHQLMQTSVGMLQKTLEQKKVTSLIIAGDLPIHLQSPEMKNLLHSLELLVVASHRKTWLTEIADWVLPMAPPLEKSERIIHNSNTLPYKALPYLNPRLELPKDAKRWSDILLHLHKEWKPSILGSSEWGSHLRLISRVIADSSAESKIEQCINLLKENIQQEEKLWFEGESDRALWRPKGQKINFAPEYLKLLLDNIYIPDEDDNFPFFLQISFPIPRAIESQPQIIIHPTHNKKENQSVRISTKYGEVLSQVRVSESVRKDTVITNAHPAFSVLASGKYAPFTGTPVLWGERCRLLPT